MQTLNIFSLLLGVFLLSNCSNTENNKNTPPNFLIIMVDDMRFSDPGCFGGDVQTPNIDQLASEGLRFTNFYNCSRCSPTRASLLTGQYAQKAGLWRNGRVLSKKSATLAEVLGANGYQTGMVGKWHLSKSVTLNNDAAQHQKWLDHQIETDEPFAAKNSYPAARGFQKHYGIIWGVANYFDPFSLVNNFDPVKEVPEDYYITSAITDSTVAYVNEFSAKNKPFFIYLAYTAPHWPIHALPEDIAKYKGMFDDGWNAMRDRRYKKQVEMGIFNAETTPLPENLGEKWESLSAEEKAFQSSKMEVHAAMIDRVDQGLGKIFEALKANNAYDNTVIVFLSDNGASPEVVKAPGYDRTSSTREGVKLQYGTDHIDNMGSEISYTGIGPAWANAVNSPMRFWKKESFNGGNNTPAIVHWPKGLKTKNGSISTETVHVMDILPTCLEIAGLKYPESINGEKLYSLDGKSILKTLKSEKREGHDYLFFEHENGRAVICGDYKLVSKCKNSREKGDFLDWELYNIATDKTETKNIIAKHSDKAKEMADAFEQWWKENEPFMQN